MCCPSGARSNCPPHPALTRWANLCRRFAAGAGSGFPMAPLRGLAGPARTSGDGLRCGDALLELLDLVSLRVSSLCESTGVLQHRFLLLQFADGRDTPAWRRFGMATRHPAGGDARRSIDPRFARFKISVPVNRYPVTTWLGSRGAKSMDRGRRPAHLNLDSVTLKFYHGCAGMVQAADYIALIVIRRLRI
jgi:hypothetical protein